MRPIDRLLADDMLSEGVAALNALNGPDFTSVLLEMMSRRKPDATTLPNVHRSNRFTRPASVSFVDLRKAEDAILSILGDYVELVQLAPATPLGAHVALGGSSQHRLVGADRRVEMAADPTLGLALEASARRRSGDRDEQVLATLQRVTRAQWFEAAESFAHFTIFGMVTAGRDRGSFEFERTESIRHVQTMVDGVIACGGTEVEVGVIDEPGGAIVAVLSEAVTSASVLERPGPLGDYYRVARFGVTAQLGGRRVDIGDGGFTDWTAIMLSDQKERLCISGLGVDRLAASMGPST